MYKLSSETIGIVNEKGKRVAVSIPADSTVEVIGENLTDGTVDLIWNEQTVNVFAIDLRQRGQLLNKTAL